MEPGNPIELKQQLHAIMNLAWIAIVGFHLLEERTLADPTWDFPMQTRYHTEPFGIRPMLDALRQPQDSELHQFHSRNLFVQLARATLPDAFEAVESYCNKHDIRAFEDQPWYGFLEALRDAFTHSGKFGPYGKIKKQRVLGSVWRGKQFFESMIDHEIPMSFFDFEDLIRLINDIGEFVDQLPLTY